MRVWALRTGVLDVAFGYSFYSHIHLKILAKLVARLELCRSLR